MGLSFIYKKAQRCPEIDLVIYSGSGNIEAAPIHLHKYIPFLYCYTFSIATVGSSLSGKTIHSMVAHLDAVTSLAVDPNGIYLMSGSKCSDETRSQYCFVI